MRIYSTNVRLTVERGNLERVKVLLEQGICDITYVLDCARKHGQPRLVRYCEEVMALSDEPPSHRGGAQADNHAGCGGTCPRCVRAWSWFCKCDDDPDTVKTLMVEIRDEVHAQLIRELNGSCSSCGKIKANMFQVLKRPSWYAKSEAEWNDIVERAKRRLPQKNGKIWNFEELYKASEELAAIEAEEAAERVLKLEEREKSREAQKKMRNKRRARARRDGAGAGGAGAGDAGAGDAGAGGVTCEHPCEQEEEVAEEEECPTCLDPMSDPRLTTRLRCGHVFHAECIQKWANKCVLRRLVATCPYCREGV